PCRAPGCPGARPKAPPTCPPSAMEQAVRNPDVKTLLLAMLVSALPGCATLQGAPDAIINLAGKSTQSNFQGKYLEQEEVRRHFALDRQHGQNLRLSYDGRSLPA